MDYKIISFDDHLDLRTKRMAKLLGERAPHVEDRDGGPVWVCDGRVWGTWRGKLKGNGKQDHWVRSCYTTTPPNSMGSRTSSR